MEQHMAQDVWDEVHIDGQVKVQARSNLYAPSSAPVGTEQKHTSI